MNRHIFTFVVLLSLLSVPQFAAAQSYSIKEMTPQVERALENRRDRYSRLEEFKASGAIGENNRGYVEVLKSEGDAAAVASAENTDRKVIYQTIAAQNDLGGAIATIEKVFAQVQREKAAGGVMIQQESGEWTKK